MYAYALFGGSICACVRARFSRLEMQIFEAVFMNYVEVDASILSHHPTVNLSVHLAAQLWIYGTSLHHFISNPLFH